MIPSSGLKLILSDIAKFQPKAFSLLSRSFRSGRIAGTYLFLDRVGAGAWQLAISFTGLLNCEAPVESDREDIPLLPCDQCRHCLLIQSLNFEGFHFALPIAKHKNLDEAVDQMSLLLERKRGEPFASVEGSGNVAIPIAVAREVRKRLASRANPGITRVAIFYQMERMLPSSADALLKLIEEPPGDTVIILTTANPEALLPTILSRAQKIKVDRVPEDTLTEYLVENYQLSDNRARLLARISGFSPGRAVGMATTDDDGDSSRRAVGFLLFKSLFIDSTAETLNHMADLLSSRDKSEAEDLLQLWQSLFRDCAALARTGEEGSITNIDFATDLTRLAPHCQDATTMLTVARQMKNALADIGRNVHIQGALMALALKVKADLRVGPL